MTTAYTTEHNVTGFQINKLNVISAKTGEMVDIADIFSMLSIYESIYSPTITGAIKITDAAGFFNDFPLTMEDQIEIEFSRKLADEEDRIPFRKIFTIFKIENFVQVPGKDLKQYTMHFASDEFIKDAQTFITKSFDNINVEEIVRSILVDPYPYGLDFVEDPGNGKGLEIDGTLYAESVVIPGWSAFNTIKWLSTKAICDMNNYASNFLFYEDKEGYKFRCFNRHILNEKNRTDLPQLVYSPETASTNILKEDNMGAPGERIEYFLNTVFNFTIDDQFNSIDNIDYGLYSGELITHDVTTKELVSYGYNYLDLFGKIETLEKNPLIYPGTDRVNKEGGFSPLYPKSYKLFDNMTKDNVKPEEWMWQRDAELQSFNNIHLNVKMSGNTDITAGDAVIFNILKEDKSDQKKLEVEYVIDKKYSGKYLVASLSHNITPAAYNMSLDLIRDSMQEELGVPE